jgi:signal transduction histidine kinase
VLPDRWIACAVHDEIGFGLQPGSELDAATTLCSQVRDSHEPVVIDRVSDDPVYCDHPTPKLYRFQSYIAVPIFRQSGEYFGNICGLDPAPRTLSDGKTLNMLRLFSQLISLQLAAEDRHERDRAALAGQREDAELREQFIAVLGHDLRNPLSSIGMGTELLLRRSNDAGDRRVLERIRSSARRIGALVDDVMDLARGRFGGGIKLRAQEVMDLATRLRHVIDEVQAAHPTRPIDLRSTLDGPVTCDEQRVEQLLSNLLTNAIAHGDADTPIAVALRGEGDTVELSVSNHGEPISAEVRPRLFEPYFRGGRGDPRNGLGLGLYIVSEIARSHGGRVEVASADGRTTFTLRMPRVAAGPS